YGEATAELVWATVEANPEIDDPALIHPGQLVTLPPAAIGTLPTLSPEETPPPVDPPPVDQTPESQPGVANEAAEPEQADVPLPEPTTIDQSNTALPAPESTTLSAVPPTSATSHESSPQ